MPYDIYGNPLRNGYCEVHPTVQEYYPCHICEQEREVFENYTDEQKEAFYQSVVDLAKNSIPKFNVKEMTNKFHKEMTQGLDSLKVRDDIVNKIDNVIVNTKINPDWCNDQ
jgi:hypothetical protein